MLAMFNLGGGEIILLIAIFLIFALAALVVVGLILFLIVRSRGKGRTAEPPPAPAAKSPAPAQSTEVMPRKCPKCGAELKADAPEGLCPACLLQRGLATEGAAPPGTAPFTPPPLAELAKLFPQLEILEIIGQGGMGAVYKARQPALDRFVALKILAPRTGGDLDFSGRFSREARALARLNHPNIVGVYDFGTVSSPAPSEKPEDKSETGKMPVLHYFIMEYVDGPNLRQVEQAGKLTPREALQIIPQICAALQFAHDEGIVHRDIKPENVLLDKKGRVKIADFGLAKILGQEADFRLTGARDVMGTPHYMAPEQVETPQEVDHRADIYSLGVVFYEMLTGELPLGKFDPPSHKVQIDVRLDDVVMRSLSKSPDRRYQHVSEVRTEVETIAQNPSSPGAQASASAFAERDYQLNIGYCLRRGWNLVKQNFWPLFGVNALVVILLVFAGSFSLTLSSSWPGFHIVSVVSLILSGPLLGGMYLYFLKLIRGERPTLETVFSGFTTCFLQLFVGNLVMTLLVGLGFVCLILPGIYLSTAWLFSLVLIIDKRMEFWPAMELSRKVITKHWWKFFGFAICLFLLKLTGIVMCIVGFFIAGPIVHAAFLYAYEDIFGANAPVKGGVTPPLSSQAPAGSRGTGWGVALGVGSIILVAFLGLVAVVGITNKAKHRAQHVREEESHRAQEEKARAMEAQRTESGIDTVSGYSQNTTVEGFAMSASQLVFSIGGQNVWSNSFSRKTAFTATLERADRGLHCRIVDSHDHTLLDVTERDSLGAANFDHGDISFVDGMVHPGPDGRVDDAGWITLGYFQPENGAALPICVKLVDEEIQAIIHIRNFSAFPPSSANVEYSAKIPPGYSLQATANAGHTHTMAAMGRYHAYWDGGGIRPLLPLRSGESRPAFPPKMDSWEQMQAQRTVMGAQLQELQDQGPVPVVFGEPKKMFSATNGAGDVWEGFLELTEAGTNSPSETSTQAAAPPQAPAPPPPAVIEPLRRLRFPQSNTPTLTLDAQHLTPEEQIQLIEAERMKFKEAGRTQIAELLPPTPLSPPIDPSTGLPSSNSIAPQNELLLLAEQPPVVVETAPISGSRDVTPGEIEIRVRFSKEMKDDVWSWADEWKNSMPESVGAPHYLADKRTCVIKARLQPGKTYAWWLNSDEHQNFKDKAGQPAVPYLLNFQTKPTESQTKP
jgi:serine/threonine protein kinase